MALKPDISAQHHVRTRAEIVRARREERKTGPKVVDVSQARPISPEPDETIHLPKFHLSDQRRVVPALAKNNKVPLTPRDLIEIQKNEGATRRAESGMLLATQSTLYGAHQIANRRTGIISGFLDRARSALETLRANHQDTVGMIQNGGLGSEHHTRSVSKTMVGRRGTVLTTSESHKRDNVRPGISLHRQTDLSSALHVGSESAAAAFAMPGEGGVANAVYDHGFASAQASGEGGVAFASGVSFGDVTFSSNAVDSFDLDT